MKAVWTFPLELAPGPQVVTMPKGAMIVHAYAQVIRGLPMPAMWAEVNLYAETEQRTFHVVATGEGFSLAFHRYIGTVHIDWTVWHIFEAAAA